MNGSYTFACENSTAAITYSFGSVNCATATADQVAAAALENFRLGRPSSYTVQLPRAGRTLQDGAANFSIANTGLFIQDSWKVNKQLSLMFGVRVDQQSVPDAPIANTAAAAAPVNGTVTGNTFTRASGGMGIDNTVTLDKNNLFQPRFGFNWDPGFERRTQVRGGFGLFQGAAATVWLSNPFSNTGAATVQFSCTSLTACATANARFNANPDAQPTLTGTPPAAAVDAISPNMEQPSVWKANLAFEHELPALPVVGSLVAGVEWLHTRTNTAIYLKNLNLGAATRIGPDGRQLFYRNEGYDPNCYTVAGNGGVTQVSTGACATPTGQSRTRALSNPNFANVILADKTTQGSGNAITLSLNKPATTGLGWGIAYTRTTATEVSPLTSSTSNSTWNTRAVFNPNEEVAANSNYTIRDRFSGNMNWSQAFIGKYRTSVGVFYEGRQRSSPYSWTYINDLNGDGHRRQRPDVHPFSAPGSGEVEFKRWCHRRSQASGTVVDANPRTCRSSQVASVASSANSSLRTPGSTASTCASAKKLPGFLPASTRRCLASWTLMNVGNFLNKKWGRIDEIGFPSRRSFVNYVGLDASGKYIYSLNPAGGTADYTTKQVERESQWAVQATLRYEF